jgi:hypothetical protein
MKKQHNVAGYRASLSLGNPQPQAINLAPFLGAAAFYAHILSVL